MFQMFQYYCQGKSTLGNLEFKIVNQFGDNIAP